MRKILLALLAVLFLVSSDTAGADASTSSASKLDELQLRAATLGFMAGLDEAVFAVSEALTIQEALEILEIRELVSSTQIDNLYRENEIAADMRFEGKLTLVTGKVVSVSRDASGAPCITLSGASPLQNVQTRFGKESMNELAKLRKDQYVRLVCSGSSYASATVILDGCSTFETFLVSRFDAAMALTAKVINGQAKIHPTMDFAVLASYHLSRILPKDSACYTGFDFWACDKEIDKIMTPENYTKFIAEDVRQRLREMHEGPSEVTTNDRMT